MTRSARIAGLLILFAATACDPNPTREQARAYLTAHRPTVERARRDVRAAFEARPAVLVRPCGAAPGCEGPSVEEQREARRELAEELLGIFDDPHVLGLAVRLDGPLSGAPSINLGLTPGGHGHGRVPAGEGTSTDDLDLGWGAYQTSFSGSSGSAGDGTMREGIEVRWEERIGPRRATSTLFLLGEDQTSPAWREAIRRR